MLCISFIFVGYNPVYDRLVERAASRLHQAYRPKTVAAHLSHLKLFLQFSMYTSSPFPPSSPSSVLAFIEFLQFNGLSPSSISGYIHSLRSKFKNLDLPTAPLYHHSVSLMLRSLAINIPQIRRVKGIFDIPCLLAIIEACHSLPLGYIYSPLFLLAFFAFLRLSNLVPTSPSTFDPLVHLCRGDVILQPTFATIVIKWSKTLQLTSQFATVQIPVLGSSPLCPVAALKLLFKNFPLPSNAPLFAIPQGLSFSILSQGRVRKTLAAILTSLNINPSSHPFHSFRRSGASLAFNSDVSLQAIQHQGTWSSDAVWGYIVANPHHQSSVSSTFQTLLHQP